ncbi:Vacuolar protein sorting-associated protein 20 [Pseudogymnoascus australis]
MGASTSKPSAQDEAILNLKIQRDRLHKYQKRITVITAREHAIAATLLKQGDRPRALLALRRKKYQESLLAKTDAQLEQLEVLTSSVEFALVQKDVVFGLQEGTRVLKEIQKEMGEVSDMLGGKISNQDEDEVEDELEALEAQVTGVMPSVPTTKLPSKERAKAREEQREEQREAMLAS